MAFVLLSDGCEDTVFHVGFRALPIETAFPQPIRILWVIPVLLGLLAAGELAAGERAPGIVTWSLDTSTPADPALQRVVERADVEVAGELGIPTGKRAFGLVDLRQLRFAAIEPDRMFYGASVPKICIVLAYLEQHAERLDALPPTTLRELELVLKRSDNDLAAKYSRLVGLEAIQELQQSERYRFYDAERGGGLWCGKHYGSPQPRRGDPLRNLSHAATVRQCLRYYLLLEQVRLGDRAVSRLLRRLFEAPRLEFHDDNFVAGLRGRDVRIFRKNGLWEDWHLDTARVEQRGPQGCVYLLAGIVQHPKGPQYLASMARRIDEALGGRPSRRRHGFVDRVALENQEGSSAGSDGSQSDERQSDEKQWVSRVVEAPIPFNELLPSWNIDVPEKSGFIVELRVGSALEEWSPWLFVGEGGSTLEGFEPCVEFEGGKVDIDWFRAERRYRRAQLRVRSSRRSGDAELPRVERLALAFTDSTGWPVAVDGQALGQVDSGAGLGEKFRRVLDVPYRSQRIEDAEISGRICSPTSVAMVLAYRGVLPQTSAVAARAFDSRHDIFGNWPRNVQAAFSFGVPGYLRRFGDWREVRASIARGQPLIISIRARPGELRGAPYEKTAGHLLVLRGFDGQGGVHVNDPAARTASTGQLVYSQGDLETVWFGTGGTAYVLLPRE